LTNFDAHLNQNEAERHPDAVTAHKIFYQAERARKQSPEKALTLFEEANPIWMDVLLEHPKFAQVSSAQEDTYEMQLKYLRHKQRERPKQFQKIVMGMWQAFPSPYLPLAGALVKVKSAEDKDILVQWPFLPWESLLSEADKNKIMPIRTVRGAFDMTHYYDGTHADALKDVLLRLTQAATPGFPMVYPGQKNLMLTRAILGPAPEQKMTLRTIDGQTYEGLVLQEDLEQLRILANGKDMAFPRTRVSFYGTWRPLVGIDAVRTVRDRIGLNR
jgi:hypothetical protein